MCLKCISFWSVLLFTMDPFAAATTALMAFIFDNNLNKIKL